MLSFTVTVVAHDCSTCGAKETPSGWAAAANGDCECHASKCVAPWNVAPYHKYPCATSTDQSGIDQCGKASACTAAPPATSSDSPQCVVDLWANLVSGERLFLVDEAYAPGPGWDMRIMCHAKGANGKVKDPFMDTKLHGTSATSAMFWQFSRMACASELPGLGIAAEHVDIAARVCSAEGESGSGESGSGEAGAVSGRRLAGSCQYPIHTGNQPTQYTGMSVRHWPQQSGWYGPLMSVSSVNGKATGSIRQTHELIATKRDGSSTGSKCVLATGGTDAADGYASEEERVKEARRTFYSGGVMATVGRESFTLRSFHFSDDTTKAAAKAAATDTVNPGLQHAKSYGGRHGCDVEIVVEFQPKAGGGLLVSAGLSLESLAKETQAALRYSVKTFQTATEVIVLAGLKQIREGQFIALLPCEEDLDVEIIRFSKLFVCKGTRASVAAAIKFGRADVSETSDISSSPAQPTTFQTAPPTSITYHPDGTTTREPYFTLELSAGDAPESCGTLYWDPLLASISFDGGSANGYNQTTGDTPRDSPSLIGPIVGGVVGALVAAALLAAFCWWKRRNGAYVTQKVQMGQGKKGEANYARGVRERNV